MMNKFSRGTVIYHKVMGRGISINELEDGMIEVRMANGQKERFYPEELETEAEIDAKNDIAAAVLEEKWRIGD